MITILTVAAIIITPVSIILGLATLAACLHAWAEDHLNNP